MQLTIIKKNQLSLFTLPEDIMGSYWITDFENGRKINLINIEATEIGWNIISNNDAFIVDNKDIMVPSAILKDYNFYLLKNNYKNEKYYLYCSPVYDKTYKELGIATSISVGSDKSNEICYRLGGIPKKAYKIEKKDKWFYMNILDDSASVYVNQKRVLKTKRIEYGDVIFTFGLKVILMRKDGRDYLLVNNPGSLLEFNASFVNIVPTESEFVEDNKELSDNSLYNDYNYFYRAPHFYNTIEKYTLNIDSPPAKKEADKSPAILTIGPMATMAMISVVMLLSTINGISSGKQDFDSALPQIVMSGAMFASSLLWPILTRMYQKFSDKAYEKKRQKLYKKYIAKKEAEIVNELEVQKKSLIENNFTIGECQNIIRAQNVKLWQRRITNSDFLTMPLGYGNKKMQIEIKYPEEHFSLSTDNLLELAYELGRKDRILTDVPITYSFYDNKTTGIVGDSIVTKEFIDRVVLQMMANYSYDELKIVTFTNVDNEHDWDYIKTLPHSWTNDKNMRFFGSSNDDYREIIYTLEKIYNERKANHDKEEKNIPHYVIITDAIKSIDSYDFIKNMMSSEENYGFSIIMLVDKVAALPNECKNFINVSREECSIYSSIINEGEQKFKIDYAPIDEIYNCASVLANIPLDIKSEIESSLPDTYQFLEMYQVGKVDQLNSKERWRKNNPILSLQAPVGIGKSGEVLTLDLHEKYHGPHGLVAGTTGSGKSEFIITYVLSLAVNYHPYEVQIILIDYKGGSLAGAFSNDMYELPHLAGTITNLDGNELNRSLASIESEVKRRQKVFNDAKRISNESTVDIYKYQKLWREGKLGDMEPVAHLFIISDEFAELKEQQPEFMEKLISVARVGRSLGIHLILATQKPGGVVDAQIWSNTRFRVCLKVQDTSDSQEVLKKPDAAYLKRTGRFYLQVGYDEVYTLGQSAWAGGQYYPNTTFKKDVDTSVNTINNIGVITTTKDIELASKPKSVGEELPHIVKYLSELAAKENIKIKKLWLDKIPDKIYIDMLKSKYNFKREPFYINPIIGEYDDPSSQNQYALTVPISKLGNAVIYGITGSGKESFITSFIYSCMTSYAPEEINFYVVDFGAETLRAYASSPYVGDIVLLDEEEKLKNLFKMLFEEIEIRKSKFTSYGGTYQSYINAKREYIANLVIIINNFEAFSETYNDYSEDLIQLLRDANKYGIYFILTASSEGAIRMKARQNIALTYVLQQNNESEYASILGNCRGKLPAKIKGRGLFKKDRIYEFQTALVAKEDSYQYLADFCKSQASMTEYRARKIPVLPKLVDYNAIVKDISFSPNMVVGVNKTTLNAEKYNFKKNPINIISSQELENTTHFINSLVNEAIYTKEYEIIFINSSEIIIQNENLNGRLYNRGFDGIIDNIATFIDKAYEAYEQAEFNEESLMDQKKYMVFIYGVYDFYNKLKDETKRKLSDIIKKDAQINLVSFVLVDNTDIIKNYAYEDWFKSGADTSRGIYIGSGIADQSLFRISRIDREAREEIPNNYGYIIQNTKVIPIKLLEDFRENKVQENN